MRRGRVPALRRRLAATAAGWALAMVHGVGQAGPAVPAPADPASDAERGERLYRDGVAAGGRPTTAVVQGDLRVLSSDWPCLNCHRRSGWGTSEGPVAVPPIVGPVLFAPVTRGHPQMGPPRTTGPGTRPAYDAPTLLRAVRDGIDAAGRPLSPTMPRYALSAEDGAALAAYLRSLSASPEPGVDETRVHLATITTPGVSAARRASMLDVLRTYVRHKNAGTRNEAARRERGPWDMAHYENYRQWVLHEWDLEGTPAEWAGQLAERYRRQPVFAIVSGLGEGEWAPMQEFSERFRVPAVLPQTPLPPPPGSGRAFYTLYFSGAVSLEAETLAVHLAGAAPPRVLQVSRCGSAGEAAAALVRVRLSSGSGPAACVEPSTTLDSTGWRALLHDRPDVLVLWLGEADRPALQALAAEPGLLASVRDVYVSSSLLGEEAQRLPAELATRAVLLHPAVPPDQFDRHAGRALAWMKASGIEAAERPVAVNALFAATLVGDALGHPRTLASREYFIERMEHMAARTPSRSAYASVTFGPQRRFGSSICHLLKFPAAAGQPFQDVTGR